MSEQPANLSVPTYDNVLGEIDALYRRYNFVSKISIGKSVLGREIFALKIGDIDNAALYAGAFHAQEWLTAMLLLRFARELCGSLDCGDEIAGVDCRKAMLGRGLVIVPVVNPDGVEIALRGIEAAGDLAGEVGLISRGDLSSWNANARGVDLNHNYDAGWHIARSLEQGMGVTGPSPRRYGGEYPESEPETRAMADLCRRYSFRAAYAFHSQGEEIFWRYGRSLPPKSALIAKLMAVSSGYELSSPDGIASHAGFKDWFIQVFNRPGFTLEIGKGENPLPVEQLDGIYARLEELLVLGIVM